MAKTPEELAEARREAGRKGGIAAHANGKARKWSADDARFMGALGGRVTSATHTSDHFKAIGKKGAIARWPNGKNVPPQPTSDSSGNPSADESKEAVNQVGESPNGKAEEQ